MPVISNLTTAQIAALSTKVIASLTTAEIAALSTAQVQAFTVTQVGVFSAPSSPVSLSRSWRPSTPRTSPRSRLPRSRG